MKIGIFGGSFNPPHNMHRDIALNLIEKGYLDKVIFVPTGDYYPKSNLIQFKHRYQMLKLMVGSNPNIKVSDYEARGELTYTYQTLDHFQSIYPNDEIYFILGSDNLKSFNKWRNYEYILKKYKILVINRNSDDIKSVLSEYKDYQNNIISADIPLKEISSTEIRTQLKNNLDLENKLDQQVLNYIKQMNLYVN